MNESPLHRCVTTAEHETRNCESLSLDFLEDYCLSFVMTWLMRVEGVFAKEKSFFTLREVRKPSKKGGFERYSHL
jgi:hypothetical protein